MNSFNNSVPHCRIYPGSPEVTVICNLKSTVLLASQLRIVADAKVKSFLAVRKMLFVKVENIFRNKSKMHRKIGTDFT